MIMPSDDQLALSLKEIFGSTDPEKSLLFQDSEIAKFIQYYKLVIKWNKLLHLTTITEPEQFFYYHIYESILGGQLLRKSIQDLWDIGSGLGIPGIPIAIERPDLGIHLIDSSKKKAIFLRETAWNLEIDNVEVLNCRFESLTIPNKSSCLTVRAIENMGQSVNNIFRLNTNAAQYLFFGNHELLNLLPADLFEEYEFSTLPIPRTTNRYIYSFVPRET